MGTLTTIFVIASLILVAITMFTGFKGIVGPRTSSGHEGQGYIRRRFGRSTNTAEDGSTKRRAA